jgi:hypothetical protein
MKIIAKTERGYIIETSGDELANLIGYYSHYSFDRPNPAPEIGNEVQIAKMFRHLYELGSAQKDIAATAAKLRTAADLIDTLPQPLTTAKAQTDGGKI